METSNRPGANPVAIVVDDSDIDREVMIEILHQGGIATYGLPSPIGATREARARGVSIAIVDQNIPAMDGSKLIALFRSNRKLKQVPIIMVSGNVSAEMVDVARNAGADAFVSKQDLHSNLLQTARRLLGH